MKVIKDFVDMMRSIEDNHSNTIEFNLLCRIMQSKPYQALKASISPVSEDKKGKWKMPIPEADEYDWSKLDHGFYKIYWKDGGCSMASVGSLHSGKRWFAPTNWTSKDHNVASSCWNKVKDVKCIMSDADFNREEEPEQPTDTKKQTLLEYVTKKYKFDHEIDAPFYRLLVVISNYLEEQNKCKCK